MNDNLPTQEHSADPDLTPEVVEPSENWEERLTALTELAEPILNDEEEEEDDVVAIEPLPTNVQMDYACRSDKHEARGLHINIPSKRSATYNTNIEGLEDADKPAASEQVDKWANSLAESSTLISRNDVFSRKLDDLNTDWKQYIEDGESRLRIGKPKIAGSEAGSKLTGNAAIFKMRSLLGVGTTVILPLVHSGIWVSIKAPDLGSIVELDTRISREKVKLGRETGGLIFSSYGSYIDSWVCNLVIDNIFDCNVEGFNKATLRSIIKQTDMPTLIWGLLCTMYPSGYKMYQPCVADLSKCQEVFEGTVNITKLLWTDNSRLEDTHLRQMRNYRKKITVEKVVEYQESAKFNNTSNVKITDDLYLDIATPSLLKQEAAGFRWVDGIVDGAEGVFASSTASRSRSEYIKNQAKATALMQYSGWVTAIKVGPDGEGGFDQVITDEDTIEDALTTLSEDNQIVEGVLNAIIATIEDSSVTVLGIPNYMCPSCEKSQIEADAPWSHIIPLDAVKTFFTLAVLRVTEAYHQNRV